MARKTLIICVALAACLISGASSSEADETESEVQQALLAHKETLAKEGSKTHDAYAYKMPSSLWMVVRYSKEEGSDQVQEYMKIVDNILEYLKHLEGGVRTVSLNVAGVETVLNFERKAT